MFHFHQLLNRDFVGNSWAQGTGSSLWLTPASEKEELLCERRWLEKNITIGLVCDRVMYSCIARMYLYPRLLLVGTWNYFKTEELLSQYVVPHLLCRPPLQMTECFRRRWVACFGSVTVNVGVSFVSGKIRRVFKKRCIEISQLRDGCNECFFYCSIASFCNSPWLTSLRWHILHDISSKPAQPEGI